MITKKFFLSLLLLINFNNVISIQEIEFKDNSLECQLNLLDMPEEIIQNIIEQLIGADKLDNIEKIKNAKDIFELYSFRLIKFKTELIEILKCIRLTSSQLNDSVEYFINKLKNKFEEKKQKFINEIKDQYADYDQNKLNSKLKHILSPRFNFSKNNLKEAIKLIITGADVNLKNNRGSNALMLAAVKNYKDIVELLLNHKDTNVNLKNRYGNLTALMWAILKDSKDIVELLLNHKDIDVNLKNDRNETALIIATEEGHKDIVELLLNHKDINVNIQDKLGKTALMIAAIKNNKDILKLLLNHKDINVNIKDDIGYNALIWVLEKGHKDILDLIKAKMN